MKVISSKLHKSEKSQKENVASTSELRHFTEQNHLKKKKKYLLKEMPWDLFQETAEKGLENLSKKDILEVLLWKSWAISQEQLQKISIEAIQSIPPKLLHNLTAKTLHMMSSQQIASLKKGQIQSLRPLQISAITMEQLDSFTNEQIKALLPTQVAAMTSQQLLHLAASGQLKFMKENQFLLLPKNVYKRIIHLKQQLFPKNKRKKNCKAA